jgi:hypothetical protein
MKLRLLRKEAQVSVGSGMASPEAIEAANTRAVMLKDEGKYHEARDYLHGSLRAARQCLGDEHPTTLSIMTNLSALLQLTGKIDEAEPLCVETLELRRMVLGSQHKDTINSMVNLGTLYETRGNYEAAEPLRHEVVATRRAMLGDGHADTLAALDNLAALHFRQGRLNDMLEVLSEEIEGHVRTFGHNCGSYLPQDTKTVAAKASEAMSALPDRGESLAARPRFFKAVQAALLPKNDAAAVPPSATAPAAPPTVAEPAPAAPAPAPTPVSAGMQMRSAPPASQAAHADVASLLRSLSLPQYIEEFEEQEMELDVMRDVALKQGRGALDECLKELGVKSMGHRLRIMNELAPN